jgi:hypothetical protein
MLAAPAHAIYRNAYGPNERSYYSLAAAELTRQWHQLAGASLPDVTGNDGLAFATAFYTADHPVYQPLFRFPPAPSSSHETDFDKGWAAVCFADDKACLGWMENVAATTAHVVRTEFVVTPRLWGQPGVPARIVAMMVLPRGDVAQLELPRSDGVKDSSGQH